MRIAYVISAYKRPELLARLVRRLWTERATFVIHIDRKTRRGVADAMVRGVEGLPAVHFLERHVCHWGGFGHVRATLKGLDRLHEVGAGYDAVVLLTGQDYPLVPVADVERRLEEAAGLSFMSWWPLPDPRWSGRGGLARVEDWHLVSFRHLHVALPLGRRLPGGLEPFGGAPYWCLSRAAVDHVRAFVHGNPDFVRFFEHVYIPDEIFFQTILMNSPLASTVVNDSLRYVDWTRTPAPAILGKSDFEALVGSGNVFARKFDPSVDAEILDLLDRHAGLEPAVPLPR